MKNLGKLFEKVVPSIATLPIIHTCEAIDLLSILQSGNLNPSLCDVFKEEYLYTFYGIPSYRKSSEKATGNNAYFPVCFIIEYENCPDMHRLLPTDSGAFKKLKEVKSDHFHEKVEIKDIELIPKLDEAKKLIQHIYHSNKNYIYQKPQIRPDDVSQVDQAAFGYLSMINDKSTTVYDNRVATIELIFDGTIKLTNKNFKHIIAPGTFLSDPEIADLIESKYNISSPKPYRSMKGKVDEGIGIVYNYYLDYLENKAII